MRATTCVLVALTALVVAIAWRRRYEPLVNSRPLQTVPCRSDGDCAALGTPHCMRMGSGLPRKACIGPALLHDIYGRHTATQTIARLHRRGLLSEGATQLPSIRLA